MTDDDDVTDPLEAEAMAEIANIAAMPEPTEEGARRLYELIEHPITMVRIRAISALLDIGYGPAEEAEFEEGEDEL